MARIKTFPKLLLIAAVVGVVGYGANYGYDSYKLKHPTQDAPQVDITPQEQPSQVPPPANIQPVSPPVVQQPQQEAVPQYQAPQQPQIQQAAPSDGDSAIDKMKSMGKM